MFVNQQPAQDGFHSHDGSHLRTKSVERPESPNQIYLNESILEEAEIERQKIGHGESERYRFSLDENYQVDISENGSGSVIRISNNDAVYRERLDYFPENEIKVRDLLSDREIDRVF